MQEVYASVSIQRVASTIPVLSPFSDPSRVMPSEKTGLVSSGWDFSILGRFSRPGSGLSARSTPSPRPSSIPGTRELLLNLIERHLIETCWMKPTGRHLLVRYKEDQDTVDALRKPSLHRIEKIGEPIALCDFRNGTFADAIAEFSQIPGEDWVRPYLRGFAISQILMERDSQFFAVGIWSKGVSRYFNPEGLGGWSTFIFILIPRKRNSTKP